MDSAMPNMNLAWIWPAFKLVHAIGMVLNPSWAWPRGSAVTLL